MLWYDGLEKEQVAREGVCGEWRLCREQSRARSYEHIWEGSGRWGGVLQTKGQPNARAGAETEAWLARGIARRLVYWLWSRQEGILEGQEPDNLAMGHGEQFQFYSRFYGKLLECFEQENDTIWFIVYKDLLAVMRTDSRDKSRSREMS